MATNRQDFQITQNTAKLVYFDINNGSVPQDLTGVPLRWRLAKDIDDAEAILEKGNTAPLTGLTVPAPATGECIVSIADTDIDDYGLFWHFLEADIGGTGWQCMARGRAVVEPSIGPGA